MDAMTLTQLARLACRIKGVLSSLAQPHTVSVRTHTGDTAAETLPYILLNIQVRSLVWA